MQKYTKAMEAYRQGLDLDPDNDAMLKGLEECREWKALLQVPDADPPPSLPSPQPPPQGTAYTHPHSKVFTHSKAQILFHTHPSTQNIHLFTPTHPHTHPHTRARAHTDRSLRSPVLRWGRPPHCLFDPSGPSDPSPQGGRVWDEAVQPATGEALGKLPALPKWQEVVWHLQVTKERIWCVLRARPPPGCLGS